MNAEKELLNDGLLKAEQVEAIHQFELNKPMSVHWELRTILYLGLLLLMSGLGILIYKNINSIGHIILLIVLSLACLYCFYYGFKNKKPYSHDEVKQTSPLFDYTVLGACLLLGLLMAYLQNQFNLFGNQLGLATLLPALVYFISAYVFDHRGILTMGISSFIATAGITLSPHEVFRSSDLTQLHSIWIWIGIGLTLGIGSYFLKYKNIKKHFDFTYTNFACNILFIALLAGLFLHPGFTLVYFLLIALLVFYFINYAAKLQSFLFLLLSVIYGYIALTYLLFKLVIKNADEGSFFFIFFYILLSCIGIVMFFINYKRILNIKK